MAPFIGNWKALLGFIWASFLTRHPQRLLYLRIFSDDNFKLISLIEIVERKILDNLDDAGYTEVLPCCPIECDLTLFQRCGFKYYLTPKWPSFWWVNSLWPSDVIWCHRIWPTLVQIITYLVGTNHFISQCRPIVNWTLWKRLQWNFNQNVKFSLKCI